MKNTKIILMLITIAATSAISAGYWDQKTGKYVPNTQMGGNKTYQGTTPDEEYDTTLPVDENTINTKNRASGYYGGATMPTKDIQQNKYPKRYANSYYEGATTSVKK
ncbi:MAG TPA: hypothetical protein VLB80_04485 [Candidatus Babeliales bacterium]|nr:hypothetical protein [Candidatus Babeliales bacterium]